MRKFIKKVQIGIICFLILVAAESGSAQGRNVNWLIGYQGKARIAFNSTSYNISPEVRKIPFIDTQGNISDENGNLLISSNGYFIADATGDTMQNGSGINPGSCTADYGPPYGMFLPYGNLILPMPEDTSKYVLFHQTCDYNSPFLTPTVTYYTVIDMTLNNGLGAVISKNNIALSDNFGAGITACKHGNGKDWWVIAISDSGTMVHKFLLSSDTVLYIGLQSFQLQANAGWAGQPVFSPNGKKFAFRNGYFDSMNWHLNISLFDFDRCSGIFSLDTIINYTDGNIGYGTMFSPNSKYLYFSTTEHIYKVDTDTSDIGATFQVVAVNDTFLSSPPNIYTNFYLMYLAANGKIYTSSTSSVLHLHEMNYPDSSGLACDMQLHNIYTGHFFIGVPNHPNYYLGRLVGSPCDTLTNINDPPEHDFRFKVFPNPTMDGNFNILYLLPQNQPGKLEVFDINGRRIYEMNLPYWSTMQEVNLPKSISSGIYNCVITSGGERGNSKVVVYKE